MFECRKMAASAFLTINKCILNHSDSQENIPIAQDQAISLSSEVPLLTYIYCGLKSSSTLNGIQESSCADIGNSSSFSGITTNSDAIPREREVSSLELCLQRWEREEVEFKQTEQEHELNQELEMNHESKYKSISSFLEEVSTFNQNSGNI